MKKLLIIFISCTIIVLFNSCKIKTEGNSLYAFTQRLNEISKNKITSDGFIANNDKKTFSKFFKFDDDEILLQFEVSDDTSLSCLHIVFDNITENNSMCLSFIENSIYAFANNDYEVTELFKKVDFRKAIFSKSLDSKQEKIGNTEIIIDATDIGTVISVVKSNL